MIKDQCRNLFRKVKQTDEYHIFFSSYNIIKRFYEGITKFKLRNVGFMGELKETEIDFAPTYSFNKHNGREFKKATKSTASYADRIFYATIQPVGFYDVKVKEGLYRSTLPFNYISDHAAVVGEYFI